MWYLRSFWACIKVMASGHMPNRVMWRWAFNRANKEDLRVSYERHKRLQEIHGDDYINW